MSVSNNILFSSEDEFFDRGKIADILFVCTQDELHFGAVDRYLPFGQSIEIRDNYEKETALRWPYFSRKPAYKYLVCTTIYEKTKIGCPNGHPIFVVRSTGIEDIRRYEKALVFKAFLR